MSLYGEYKAGLLDESQYTRACREEAMEYGYSSIWAEEEEFDDDDIDDF